jgi:hypothetical protein
LTCKTSSQNIVQRNFENYYKWEKPATCVGDFPAQTVGLLCQNEKHTVTTRIKAYVTPASLWPGIPPRKFAQNSLGCTFESSDTNFMFRSSRISMLGKPLVNDCELQNSPFPLFSYKLTKDSFGVLCYENIHQTIR